MRQFIAGICCAIVFGGANAAAENNVWREYIYADDGFAISAPAKPMLEKQKAELAGTTSELRLFSVTTGGQRLLMLLLFQRAQDDRRSEQEFLDQLRTAAQGVDNNKLISQSAVKLGNYPGLEIELESQNPKSKDARFHFRNRYFVVGLRLYQLMSVAPSGDPLSPDTDRWFQSFRLIAAPGQRR